MEVVYKYELSAAERQRIQLPVGSKILSLVNQFERPVLYVRHAKNQSSFEPCLITVVLTGAPIPPDAGEFIGSLLLSGGHYVLHVFAVYPPASGVAHG